MVWAKEWDWMLAELDELCPEAAIDMREIRKSTNEFVAEHEASWIRLQDLLHDIEWWRSNDYGKDQVDEAILKYRRYIASTTDE